MLLSNLTASSLACSTLLSLKVSVIPDTRLSRGLYPTDSRSGSCAAPVPYPPAETQEVLALPLLVDAFVEGAQVVENDDLSKRTRKGNLNFLATVFANLSMVCYPALARLSCKRVSSRLLDVISSFHRNQSTYSNQETHSSIRLPNLCLLRSTRTRYEGVA